MNCDTAFDLMTDAGAFRSTALVAHLETCQRCRQMQATLAPALEFLGDLPHDDVLPGPTRGPEACETLGSYGALVTTEGLLVAQQAARDLGLRTERPVAWLKRLAGRGLRYAAVFAAGAAIAFALLPNRDRAAPGQGECTRSAVRLGDQARSADQIQALFTSCLACHGTSRAEPDRSSGWLSRGRTEAALLGEAELLETLLASGERVSATGAILCAGRRQGADALCSPDRRTPCAC